MDLQCDSKEIFPQQPVGFDMVLLVNMYLCILSKSSRHVTSSFHKLEEEDLTPDEFEEKISVFCPSFPTVETVYQFSIIQFVSQPSRFLFNAISIVNILYLKIHISQVY